VMEAAQQDGDQGAAKLDEAMVAVESLLRS
jgi:hypothetical protein